MDEAGNETTVTSEIKRHGNWDSVTQGALWEAGISEHNLPPSLYRGGKPNWWGSLAWPAIGPDLNPIDGQIPAQQRYYSINPDNNNAPTIDDIANQTTSPNVPTASVGFKINDVETAPAVLTLIGSSSNPSLVPNANIVFGGSGTDRTVTVTPIGGQSGDATITVTVCDGFAFASDTFTLTIVPPPPFAGEGFEGPGFENAGWTLNDTPNPDYTPALDGLQSLNCVGGQYISRPFEYWTSFNMYFRVRWNTLSTGNRNIIYWQAPLPSYITVADVRIPDGGSQIQILHGGAFANGMTVLAVNQTYHVWVEWTKGNGNNGTMKLFVSTSTTGTKPAMPEASITSGNGGATGTIFVGPAFAGPDVIYDRLQIGALPLGNNGDPQ